MTVAVFRAAVIQTANTLTVDLRVRIAASSESISPQCFTTTYAAVEEKHKQAFQAAMPQRNHLPSTVIQIIKFRNESMETILSAFDIDVCAFGYNGKDVFASNRAREALTTGRISAPLEHHSWRTHERLLKYCARGFGLRVPDLDVFIDISALLAEGDTCTIVVFLIRVCSELIRPRSGFWRLPSNLSAFEESILAFTFSG